MSLQTETPVEQTEVHVDLSFQDRRQNQTSNPYGLERRQFGNSHHRLSPEARELAEAIDSYKLQNRRRFINYEEMLAVIQTLGYTKS